MDLLGSYGTGHLAVLLAAVGLGWLIGVALLVLIVVAIVALARR